MTASRPRCATGRGSPPRTPGPWRPHRPQRSAGVRLATTSRGSPQPGRGRPRTPPGGRLQGWTVELGGRPKHAGPPQPLTGGAMAQAVTDLAKRGTGDADRAVDVIDQPANVIQDEWEVRVELAFH